MNSLSLSIINSLGTLCSNTSALVTSYAHSPAVIVSSVGTNFAALVNRSTITSMLSQNRANPSSSDFGSFTIKSIVTLLYSLVSGFKGCNRL